MRRLSLGTALLLGGCATPAEAPAETATWSGGVRTLVAERCAGCHFDGGGSPFALQTWEQASALSASMLAAVEAGTMPPWKADPACREFEGQAVLSDDEVALLRAWVDGGAPEGAPTEPIEVATRTLDATATFAPAEAYTPDFSTEEDDYHCFVLDETFDRETFLTALRIVPGTPQVHHVLLFVLTGEQLAQMEALDAAEPGLGYTCFGSPVSSSGSVSVLDSVGGLPEVVGVWTPGAEPAVVPEGTAYGIGPGARIVMQVHYSDVGDTQADLTMVEVVHGHDPPAQLLRSRPILDTALDIPAGDAEVVVEKTVTNWTGGDTELRAALPHMHLLGTRISAEIGRAGGATECLVDVPAWDFDWQLRYVLPDDAHLVVAPQESITLTCTYDNSSANQASDHDPVDAGWGEGTMDEMCLLYTEQVEPYRALRTPTDPACRDWGACAADCDEPSLDYVASCDEADLDCTLCAVQATVSCGATACAAEALPMQACLVSCMGSSVTFGGGLGACLHATCGEDYAALLDCVDPIVASGACDEALAGCGVEL